MNEIRLDLYTYFGTHGAAVSAGVPERLLLYPIKQIDPFD
jgi:hypothetical protein